MAIAVGASLSFVTLITSDDFLMATRLRQLQEAMIEGHTVSGDGVAALPLPLPLALGRLLRFACHVCFICCRGGFFSLSWLLVFWFSSGYGVAQCCAVFSCVLGARCPLFA